MGGPDIIRSPEYIEEKNELGGTTRVQFVLLRSYMATAPNIFFTVDDDEGDCVGDQPTVTFRFINGEIIPVSTYTNFNCDGRVVVRIYGRQYKKLQETMLETGVEKIRIQMHKGYVDFKISDENADFFKHSLKCMLEYKE